MVCTKTYQIRAFSTCSGGAKTTPLAVKLLMIASVIVLSAFNVFTADPVNWQAAAGSEMTVGEDLAGLATVESAGTAEIDSAPTMLGCPVTMNMMVSCWFLLFPGITVDINSTTTVSPAVFDAMPARFHHHPIPEVLTQPPQV